MLRCGAARRSPEIALYARRTNIARLLPLLSSTAAALLAVGCASSWPIDPGDPVRLGADEGLLVVHVHTNRPLRSIHISGTQAAEDVPEGTQVRLIGITAGSYLWSEVEIREYVPSYWDGEDWPQYVTFSSPSIDRLRFHVEPGVINYVGMLDVERKGTLRVEVNSLDRTAIALEELRRRYSDLTARYRIVYSGPAPNVFLEHYLDALAKRTGSRDSAASPRVP